MYHSLTFYLRSSVDAYSNSNTYKVGAIVSYDGLFYKCITAITTVEAFDASHWEVITEKEARLGKNTWEDWHLVPSSRPLFLPPAQKTTVIEIPGFDGVIDLSTSLTKFPVYSNRTGSIKFIVMNGYEDWTTKYSEIMDYLHGRTLEAVLEDDKEFAYSGRFVVSDWTSNSDGTWSTITVDYDLEPYKLRLSSTTSQWLWDPFNFETGIIQYKYFNDLTVDSDDWVEFDFTGLIERKPVVPKFNVTLTSGTEITAQLYNKDLEIEYGETYQNSLVEGENEFYNFIFCELNSDSSVKMRFKGHGTVSIEFRSGGL